MRRQIERRLAFAEEFLPLPITAKRFVTRTQRLAKRKRISVSSAMDAIVRELSDPELEALAAELENLAFGSDTAARDKAKREFFAAAGCPDLDKTNVQEMEGFTW